MQRRIVAALAAVVLLVAAFTLPGVAQTKTTLVFSAGPTGGSWTPMAAATEVHGSRRYERDERTPALSATPGVPRRRRAAGRARRAA